MAEMLFIYNPNAGKGAIKKCLSEVLEKFSRAGFTITVFPTEGKGDAKDRVSGLEKHYDVIVCAGGDGTFNEVVNGFMKLKEKTEKLPKIGYLPTGTMNDFASSLHIPKNIQEAVDVVIEGVTKDTDIGDFSTSEDRFVGHFTYVAAFGAFTEVSYETSQDSKNMIGKVAYFLEGLKSLPKIRPYHMRVIHDEGEIEDDFVFGMVTNSKSVGGFKGITGPEVYLDDGLFDAILVKNPKNPLDFQNIINSFLKMDMESDSLYHFHSAKVKFIIDEELPWTVDGEAGGIHKEVLISNHKQAISIIVPKDEPILIMKE